MRHGENAPWAPQRDEVGAISAELAFNVAVSQGIMLKQQKPWEIYDCFKLQVKDTGRPRFHVLVREPSREEISDEKIMPYMIRGGPLAGKYCSASAPCRGTAARERRTW